MSKKRLLFISLGTALVLTAPLLTGCIGTTTPPAPAVETSTKPDDFALAVVKVSQDSTLVEVIEYVTRNKVMLTRDNANYTELLQLLSASTTKEVTTKSAAIVENGKTVTVQRTIPYPMGMIITFDLKDGLKVKFNITSDTIWFETDEAIYQASGSPELYALAKSFIGVASSIIITPSPGAYLTNSENVSSEVLLKDVQVNKGVSDKKYISPWYPAGIVNVGEPILVVSGSIQNKHKEYKEIAMYAEGYDADGKQVAWTLDAAHIAGQIGLHLENEETGQFILHLNLAENLKSIRIYANNYPITPP